MNEKMNGGISTMRGMFCRLPCQKGGITANPLRHKALTAASFLSTHDKNDRCKPFFDGLQRFFVIISPEYSCRSAGTILYIFRCMPANWLRTIFPALLIKNADLLIRFSRPIFRMGPTPAMQPVCWPVLATCEAVPPGPPNPMWREPIPLVLPGGEPNADQDWHRRRSQTSGR